MSELWQAVFASLSFCFWQLETICASMLHGIVLPVAPLTFFTCVKQCTATV